MTRQAIWIDADEPLPRVVERVRAAERDGLARVWIGDAPVTTRDVFPTLALCARATQRLKFGAAMDVSARHPTVIACGMASLDEMYPGRIALALWDGGAQVRSLGLPAPGLEDVGLHADTIAGLLQGKTLPWHGKEVRTRFVDPSRGAVPVSFLLRGGLDVLEGASNTGNGRTVVWFAEGLSHEAAVDAASRFSAVAEVALPA